jgi:hypothetical protein
MTGDEAFERLTRMWNDLQAREEAADIETWDTLVELMRTRGGGTRGLDAIDAVLKQLRAEVEAQDEADDVAIHPTPTSPDPMDLASDV